MSDNTDNIVTRNENKKKRGRPRKYADDAARSKAWKTKNNECRRLDCFISPSVSWRIRKLSKAWKIPISETVERLLLEGCESYEDLLFDEDENYVPETKI